MGGAVPKKHKRTNLKLSILAVTVMALPLGTQAAGLGKLSVLSALGQPLRAELDVTAGADELNSLSARVAPADVFRQANIEYASSLGSLRFTLEKRPGGQPYFRITSDRPIGDPFLDFLVELNWSAGRLVREYTFLLDPPELKPAVQEAAVAPVTVPETVKPAEVVQRLVREAVPEARPPRREPRPVPGMAPSGEGRLVKRGDTLGKIAAEHKPDGVSLDQMLVALFRSNPDAFDGGNMNRLKAGKILSLPGSDAVAATPASEARGIVLAQSADFDAYRRKLAASVATSPAVRDGEPQQAAAGKITPRIEDRAAQVPGQDKLQVSRTEAGKSAGVAAKGTGRDEDTVTRDKALKEAKSRIAELEKNLADLKKLAEMKSQAGAAMQQQAQVDKAAPLVEAKKEEAVAAIRPSEPVPSSVPAKAPEVSKGGESASAPGPAPQTTTVPPKKPVTPPPPSPSFIAENGPLVFGGGGLLALLAGYFGFRTWQRKRSDAAARPASVTDSSLYASSVFSASGGKHVDTGAAAAATDFGLGTADDSDGHEAVDPVQEADVYLAYGRDAQAEEILLDALKQDPTRLTVHLKLLEVYADRRAVPQFNTVATDLHAQTGGAGAEWEKALLLGRTLDPSNPLYGETSATSAETLESYEPAAATVIMPAVEPESEVAPQEELPASLDFDLDLSGPVEVAAPEVAAEQAEAPPAMEAETVSSLDFDLGLDTKLAQSAVVEPAVAMADEEVASLDFELGEPESSEAPTVTSTAEAGTVSAIDSNVLDFDFDLGAPAETPVSEPVAEVAALEIPVSIEPPAVEVADDRTIDFDLDTEPSGVEQEAVTEEPVLAEVSAVTAAPSVDFDFDLDLAESVPETPAAEAASTDRSDQVPPLPDLSGISLELDTPADISFDEPSASLPDLGGAEAVEDNPEAATKLELAQAYEEMGDKEGARELFQEVISEGSPAQQALARDKLARLG